MKLIVCKGYKILCCKKITSLTVGSEYVVIGPMVLVLVLVLALVLNLLVLVTSLQDALDRRRGELTRSAHPNAPHLARRGEPTPNTPSVIYYNFRHTFVPYIFGRNVSYKAEY